MILRSPFYLVLTLALVAPGLAPGRVLELPSAQASVSAFSPRASDVGNATACDAKPPYRVFYDYTDRKQGHMTQVKLTRRYVIPDGPDAPPTTTVVRFERPKGAMRRKYKTCRLRIVLETDRVADARCRTMDRSGVLSDWIPKRGPRFSIGSRYGGECEFKLSYEVYGPNNVVLIEATGARAQLRRGSK